MIKLLTCEGSSWTCLKKRFQTSATAIILTTGTHLERRWGGRRKKIHLVCLYNLNSSDCIKFRRCLKENRLHPSLLITFRSEGGQPSTANISITVAWSGIIGCQQLYYRQSFPHKNLTSTEMEHSKRMMKLFTCEGSSWTCLKKRFQTAATAINPTTGTHLERRWGERRKKIHLVCLYNLNSSDYIKFEMVPGGEQVYITIVLSSQAFNLKRNQTVQDPPCYLLSGPREASHPQPTSR